MRNLLFVAFIFVFAFNIFAQDQPPTDLSAYGVKIEPDKRVMVVLASLEAARTKNTAGAETAIIKTNLSATGAAFRARLDKDLEAMPDELRQKINFFVTQYKNRHSQASDAELIAPFISMAYTLSPVPDLSAPARTDNLPDSLLEVLDYVPLVREFYRSSGFAAKLDDYYKDYQSAGDKLRPSAEAMTRRLLDFLHTRPQTIYTERVKVKAPTTAKKNDKAPEKIEIREHERRFYIVPEMLAPAGTINFRNIGDDYYVVVAPETNLSDSEARRAFLQFVADPLIFNNAIELAPFRDGIKSLLDERRKTNPNISSDIYLAAARSLVVAADAKESEFRLVRNGTAQARQKIDTMKTDAEKRAVSAELNAFKQKVSDETTRQLAEGYENGAVLSFYFAGALNGLAESGFDIAGSMRDIILSLAPAKEANRLAENAEARHRAENVRGDESKKAAAIIENPVTKQLLAISETVKAKNYSQAETDLKKLLAENPGETRITYSLGRVISLSAENVEDPDARDTRLLEAKVFYNNVVSTVTKKLEDDEKAAADKKMSAAERENEGALLSLSYVALARMYEFYDDNEYAAKLYEAAIKLGEIPQGAYREAVAARDKLLKKQ